MDRILIKNLLLRGIVGINDDERVKRQDILININLFGDFSKPGASDDIADTLNYRSLTKEIINYVENSKPYLVEHLATEIAKFCIKHGAEKATVRVEKPGALRFAESVGIEITRQASDFHD